MSWVAFGKPAFSDSEAAKRVVQLAASLRGERLLRCLSGPRRGPVEDILDCAGGLPRPGWQRAPETRHREPGLPAAASWFKLRPPMPKQPKQPKQHPPKSRFNPADITATQCRRLKALAHPLEPVVRVGHDGVTPGVRGAVDRALFDHELIKVRLYEPEDKKAMAADLAQGSCSALCGLVGHTVLLYRPNPKTPTIRLARP